MSAVKLGAMRRMRRRLSTDLADLVDWPAFSLDAVRDAVARRAGGAIVLFPCHWETRGFFGLTLGCRIEGQPRWLVVYEREADRDHRLMIVLHELMHIALGHCRATLSPQELRQALASFGLITARTDTIVYARACMHGADAHLPGADQDEEAEAELAAAWIVTRARRAGSLPRAGHIFSPEHIAISAFLGGVDVPSCIQG